MFLHDRPTYAELESRIEKLESALQECQRLSVSNQYAAAIMHEVNNPLEAITNLAYLIEKEPQSESAAELIRMLQEQLIVLTEVSRSSLAFYRDKKSSKPVNVASLIDSVAKLHQHRFEQAGIHLMRRCPDAVSCGLVASEMLQVLSNLILNALDACPKFSGAQVSIRLRQCPDCIHILIHDNGAGIPEEVEAKLFQAHATGKPTGSGFGLWLSDQIVREHRGTIRYRTSRKPGKSGTAFRIFLPCESVA